MKKIMSLALLALLGQSLFAHEMIDLPEHIRPAVKIWDAKSQQICMRASFFARWGAMILGSAASRMLMNDPNTSFAKSVCMQLGGAMAADIGHFSYYYFDVLKATQNIFAQCKNEEEVRQVENVLRISKDQMCDKSLEASTLRFLSSYAFWCSNPGD